MESIIRGPLAAAAAAVLGAGILTATPAGAPQLPALRSEAIAPASLVGELLDDVSTLTDVLVGAVQIPAYATIDAPFLAGELLVEGIKSPSLIANLASYGLQRYINNRLAYRHRGVDIAAAEGTPVLAAAGGVVSLADDSFLLHGQTVVIDHGHGISSLYIHLSGITVEAGERVRQGQVIGQVGATGVATGPHLHFAVYAYHVAVDPLFWAELPKDWQTGPRDWKIARLAPIPEPMADDLC